MEFLRYSRYCKDISGNLPTLMYPQAHHLYDRCREYLKNGFPERGLRFRR